MKEIMITNNKSVMEKFNEMLEVIYLEDYSYTEVLLFVRDKIHKGHTLLTHPLSGSIKPNETPYKSILISKKTGDLDTSGLLIMEESISTAEKFIKNKPTPKWTEKILDDFRVIDLSLIEVVARKLGYHC